MAPETLRLLRILRQLDEVDVLVPVYGLRREDDAPLDKALYAWRDAGCPDSKRIKKTKAEVAGA